ncbi:MAG: hypothetical protein AAGA33_04210 [Pseudomonadota bacterium]
MLSRIEDRPLPDCVMDALRHPAYRNLIDPLQYAWDTVFASTQVKIQLHQPACPCLSAHEQALVTAIRCLQSRETAGGYMPSMLSVIPSISANALKHQVQMLADTLKAAELSRRVDTKKSAGNVISLRPAHGIH